MGSLFISHQKTQVSDERGTNISDMDSVVQIARTVDSPSHTYEQCRHDELVLPSRLPPEVLEIVFTICMSRLYLGYSPPSHPLAWSQVCRWWRSIALQSQCLWSRIDLSRPAFAACFLDRSQTAPVSVMSKSPFKNDPSILIPHAERLHSIDLSLPIQEMAALFSGIQFRTHSLAHLKLQLPTPTSTAVSLDTPLPTVRHLELTSVSVRWETLNRLTHLSLGGLGQDLCPSLDELSAICSRSPDLEYIRFESLSPPDLGESLCDVVPLNNLKTLITSGSPAFVRSILQRITFTTQTALHLFTTLSEDLHQLFPDNRFPSGNPRVRFEAPTIRFARHGTYFLKDGASPWSSAADVTGFSISSSRHSAIYALNSIPTLLTPYLVTAIEFSSGVLNDIPDFTLRWSLSQLHNLQALRIAFNNIAVLLNLLMPSKDGMGVLCPRLTTMAFNRPGSFWGGFANFWFDAILECVVSRHRLDHPLTHLIFRKCQGMTGEMEERFQPFLRGPDGLGWSD